MDPPQLSLARSRAPEPRITKSLPLRAMYPICSLVDWLPSVLVWSRRLRHRSRTPSSSRPFNEHELPMQPALRSPAWPRRLAPPPDPRGSLHPSAPSGRQIRRESRNRRLQFRYRYRYRHRCADASGPPAPLGLRQAAIRPIGALGGLLSLQRRHAEQARVCRCEFPVTVRAGVGCVVIRYIFR